MSQFRDDTSFVSDFLVYQYLVEQGHVKTAKLLLQVDNFQKVPFDYHFIQDFILTILPGFDSSVFFWL